MDPKAQDNLPRVYAQGELAGEAEGRRLEEEGDVECQNRFGASEWTGGGEDWKRTEVDERGELVIDLYNCLV